jgi:hypothetical protein
MSITLSNPNEARREKARQANREVLRARNGDPDTSQAAMAAYDRDTLRAASDLVVMLHREHGPLADYELQALFRAAYTRPCCDHLYRQARSTARDRGQIRDSGERRVNPVTHREQIVWAYCDAEPVPVERCESCGRVCRSKVATESVKTGPAPQPGQAGYLASLPVVASIDRRLVKPTTTDSDSRGNGLLF